MSLLDDVSIVVTPNGYKAGELYAVVPVPTEGAEILSQPVDLVTDFIAVNGASIVDVNTFTTTGGSVEGMTKASIFTVGKRYKLIIEGTTTSSVFSLGNTTAGGNEYGTGFGTHIFTASGNTTLWIRQSTAGTTDITSFTIKEYTAADMDVTRATAATRVDENGLVNYAEVIGDSALTGNNSNFDTGIGSWVGYNGGSVSHSTDKLEVTLTSTQSGARIDTNSLISGGQAGKTFKVRARIWQGTTTNITTLIFMGGDQKGLSISSTPTYFEVELTPINTSYLTIYRASGVGGVSTFFIDDVTVKEVTRDNVPRIDYTGGGCPHILAEPQRTNLVTYSSDFSQSYWTKQSGIVATYNTTETLSPDGTYNATKFIGNGSTGVYKASIGVSGVVSRSVYLKSVSGTTTAFFRGPNTSLPTPIALTITNEWQRFELIGDNGSALQGLWIDDIGSDGLYMWGAQLEAGSYATSYIPTSGSTVTRNQDQFTRDGIGSLINSTEGVLFLEIAALVDEAVNRQISISDNSTNNVVAFSYSGATNNINATIKISGVVNRSFDYVLSNVTQDSKIAIRYSNTEFSFWVDGTETNVNTLASSFSEGTLNRLALDSGAGSQNFFGKVKQLQVYKTALTDEQLIQLTGESGTDFYESYAEMAAALNYTIQ